MFFREALYCKRRFNSVGRDNDRHVRDDPHYRYVFVGLMSCSVLAGSYAAVGHYDLNVRSCIRDRNPYLVPRPAGPEDGESAGENDFPAGSKAGRRAYHVLLRDAHIKETVREFFCEEAGLSGIGQIGIQDNNIQICPSKL